MKRFILACLLLAGPAWAQSTAPGAAPFPSPGVGKFFIEQQGTAQCVIARPCPQGDCVILSPCPPLSPPAVTPPIAETPAPCPPAASQLPAPVPTPTPQAQRSAPAPKKLCPC